MVLSVLLPTGVAGLIQFGGQYNSLLYRKLLFNCQKPTQALTLLQCEFGFFSRSIQTLLEAVEKGKRKRMQVDIDYFPFIPSLSSVSVGIYSLHVFVISCCLLQIVLFMSQFYSSSSDSIEK